MPIFPYEKTPVAHAAMNALNNSGLADATINALTNGVGLVNAVKNQATKYADQAADYLRWSQDIQVAIDALIFTDAIVLAATTLQALRVPLIAIDANLSASHQAGSHWTA